MFNYLLLVAPLWFVNVANARLMFLELGESKPADYSQQLNNQNIVMIGDSLMRYQYLSLANLVHTNSFVSPSERPNLLIHHSYKSREVAYMAASELLAPNEFSECFWGVYENHYYRNKERNFSLSYITYSGLEHSPKGVWMPTDAERFPSTTKLVFQNTTPAWGYSSVEEVFTEVLTKLDPRPTTVVLNTGQGKNDRHERGQEEAVLTAARKNFDRVIWKTTNYDQNHQAGNSAHDHPCSYPGIECLNQDWTKFLSPEHYTDRLHFTPEIYSDINTQFIYQLTKRKPFRATPLAAAHHGQVVLYKAKEYFVDKEGLLRPFTLPQLTAQNADCHKDFAARKRVHKPWMTLITHILGEHIGDICVFIAL